MTRPLLRRAARATAFALTLAGAPAGPAQNVVDPGAIGKPLAPITVTPEQVAKMLDSAWTPPAAEEAIQREVEAFCAGHPWRPFHSVLGISGFETYFSHPDELFFVMSLAGPGASPKLEPLLRAELESHPPYAVDGFSFTQGTPRELYDVPPALLPPGSGKASDLFGVYAFELFCRRFDHTPDAAQLAAVRARVQPLLDRTPATRGALPSAGADQLNGDIAGLIGAWRLARRFAADSAFEASLARTTRELLEQRINLERQDLRPWTPTRFASKSLHTGSLARYLRLTPELGLALQQWTGGTAASRVATLRKRFPTWWIARGDRLIGGENYTSPLHFSRALWQATAWCDPDPVRWRGIHVDIPWCRADLSHLERLVLRPR